MYQADSESAWYISAAIMMPATRPGDRDPRGPTRRLHHLASSQPPHPSRLPCLRPRPPTQAAIPTSPSESPAPFTPIPSPRPPSPPSLADLTPPSIQKLPPPRAQLRQSHRRDRRPPPPPAGPGPGAVGCCCSVLARARGLGWEPSRSPAKVTCRPQHPSPSPPASSSAVT